MKKIQIQALLLRNKVIIIPLILSGVLILVTFVYIFLLQQVHQNLLFSKPIIGQSFAPYPSFSQTLPFTLTGEAAVVMDDASKVILFQKNPQLQFSPASTTKIMTALVALDHSQLSDIYTIKSTFTQPVIAGFIKGQHVTLENLLYAMLLPSANDAAFAIAENFPGGQEAFIVAMNKKAAQFHLYHTHFADSIGLEDDGDYTTVVDLARLTSIAMQNKVFAKIVGTKYYTVRTLDGMVLPVKNINELLGYYGVEGVKTGYTYEAKQVLVTSVKRDSHRLIMVVMKSDDRFADTRVLIHAIADTLTYSSNHQLQP